MARRNSLVPHLSHSCWRLSRGLRTASSCEFGGDSTRATSQRRLPMTRFLLQPATSNHTSEVVRPRFSVKLGEEAARLPRRSLGVGRLLHPAEECLHRKIDFLFGELDLAINDLMRFPFFDTTAPRTPCKPEKREYRARGMISDQQVGQPSAIVTAVWSD